ncbi:MAG: asparagine synthase-related protein [Candidatus Alcyoniella australis]|nr:asparagine synthase-related protein [Candidatus Alcyoniella australis]
MPGIAGLFDSSLNAAQIEQRLNSGSRRIRRTDDQSIDSQAVDSFGVAAIFRNRAVPGASLLHGDEGLLVAVDGELRRCAAIHPDKNPATLVATLYREHGEDWVKLVQGEFSTAIYDPDRSALLLQSDRFGIRPLYYASNDQSVCFASTMAALVAIDPQFGKELDWQSVADYFAYEMLLADRSFLRGVQLVPAGSTVRVSDNAIQVGRYWSIEQIEIRRDESFDAAVDRADELLQTAVDGCCSDGLRHGLYITSGLDSRLIAGCLQRSGREFDSFTYGIPGCRDMVWGAELAALTGGRHHRFPLENGRWIVEHAQGFIAATEGIVQPFHSHGISVYPAASELIDVHLSGHGGGAFLGLDTSDQGLYAENDPQQKREKLDALFRLRLCKGFSQADYQRLFTPEAYAQLDGLYGRSFGRELDRFIALPSELMVDGLTLNSRFRKFFSYLMAAERDFYELRCPFMDYNLIDYVCSLPFEIRAGRRLQIGMISQKFPNLAKVPWQGSGSSLGEGNAWDRLRNRLRLSADRLLGDTIPALRLPTEPGRNYPQWAFADCTDWMRRIFGSERLRHRGILNADYLIEMLDGLPEVMQNQPYQQQRIRVYRLGMAISFELMCRRVFDGSEN